MTEDQENKDYMWVATADDAASRKSIIRAKIEVETLADNMTEFLGQIEQILSKTPDTVEKFQLVEFAVEAQISAKGTLALLGSGGEVGGSGGLKFVFRKTAVPVTKPETKNNADEDMQEKRLDADT